MPESQTQLLVNERPLRRASRRYLRRTRGHLCLLLAALVTLALDCWWVCINSDKSIPRMALREFLEPTELAPVEFLLKVREDPEWAAYASGPQTNQRRVIVERVRPSVGFDNPRACEYIVLSPARQRIGWWAPTRLVGPRLTYYPRGGLIFPAYPRPSAPMPVELVEPTRQCVSQSLGSWLLSEFELVLSSPSDAAGVRVRSEVLPVGYVHNALSGFIAVGAVVLGWRALISLRSARALGRNCCPRCWYSLANLPHSTCPECGWSAEKHRAASVRRA